MTTFTGTQQVERGLYLNLKRFSMTVLERRGTLPGTEEDTYRRVPVLLMLAVAPVVGLVYVIFLPFVGFAAAAVLAGEKVKQAAADVRARRIGTPALAFNKTGVRTLDTDAVDAATVQDDARNSTDEHAR
jgi:hypothetical protein